MKRRGAALALALLAALRLAAAAEPAGLLARINETRTAKGLRPLHWDAVAVPILKEAAHLQGSGPSPSPTQVYARIAEARGWPASGGAFRVFRGRDAEEALAQALAAPQLLAPGHTHVALAVEALPTGDAAALLFLATLPLPDGGVVRPGDARIHRCPACGYEWPREAGERPGIGCPQCGLLAEGYVDDVRGRYHWATYFAQPFTPIRVDNPFLAWKWTNENVHYNHAKAEHNLRGWQTPAETARLKNGVCRDTAVLLAAWLRSMNVAARVVTGFHEDDGHAWVVMSDGQTRYLLETTIDGTPSQRYPPRLELATAYVPARLMFDDKRVWLNRGRQRVRDYFSEAIWAEVKEAP